MFSRWSGLIFISGASGPCCVWQAYKEAMKEMPWKGIVHNNATVANLVRKAELRVLPAVIVVDDKVGRAGSLFS